MNAGFCAAAKYQEIWWTNRTIAAMFHGLVDFMERTRSVQLPTDLFCAS
jgi:hypothetical protein